jgi:hypothetical protein
MSQTLALNPERRMEVQGYSCAAVWRAVRRRMGVIVYILGLAWT